MQEQSDQTKELLHKEKEAAMKDLDEARANKEASSKEIVDKLTAGNEKLKDMVSSLEQKIDETEKKYEDTNKLSEERLKQVIEAESKIHEMQTNAKLLDERQSINVWRYLQAIDKRPDITEGLKKLKCRTLIFVGDSSPFHSEALHMTGKLDRRYCALVEVQVCGSMVTEEQPHAILIPLEYFLMGYGLYRPSPFTGSPRSPLSPSCISPELLSPESMGLKLKPIKTRVSSPDSNTIER